MVGIYLPPFFLTMNIIHFKEKKYDEGEHCQAMADVINNAILEEKLNEKTRTDIARKEAKDHVVRHTLH